MVRRIIVIVLVVAAIALVVNDLSHYASAQRGLRSTTYDLALWAGKNAQQLSRDQAARELAVMASEKGVTVYQYGQGDNSVQVWTKADVNGTLVAGALVHLFRSEPVTQIIGAPFTITDYREAGVQ